jgi:hypothetical protein
VHAFARDQIADRTFVVERGEDRSLRPGSRDVGKDALGASTLVEIVMDQRDPNGSGILSGKNQCDRGIAQIFACDAL